jgi:hypothetical protein
MVYPWHDVFWNIAVEYYGLEPELVEYTDISETQKHLPLRLNNELLAAIFSGEVPAFDSTGRLMNRDMHEDVIRHAHVHPESINCWLKGTGHPYQWQPERERIRRPQSQRRQETVVLAAIQSLGIDPLNLEAINRFTPNHDKQRIRELVMSKSPNLFSSQEIFNKAWERLRGQKLIRNRSP